MKIRRSDALVIVVAISLVFAMLFLRVIICTAWYFHAVLPVASTGLNGSYISVVEALGVGAGIVSRDTNIDSSAWQYTALPLDGTARQVLPTAQTAKVDITAPELSISLSGIRGGEGYFRSAVSVSLVGTDASSGVASVAYRLDGGNWVQANSLTIAMDGDHGLEGRVTGKAGNVTHRAIAVHIDTIPPVAAFIMPAPGVATAGHGVVALGGKISDMVSGVAAVELSFDDGKTWKKSQFVNGIWRYDWDATRLPNGEYQVIARAEDIAGNVQSSGASVIIIVANEPDSMIVLNY
jgi:hypothetical protein